MSLEEGGNGMVMPVGPMYGGGMGSGFGNGFGGDGWWILLLFILLGNGSWGNGFGGGFNNDIYPWMNQSNQINGGFRDQMLNTSISGIQNSITAGFGDVQNSLCSGFAGVNASLANGFAQAEIAENSRQMANMNQMFGIQSALQNCCCENRANIADLKYTVASEACSDRQAVNDGVTALLANQNAGIQRILDTMCQDKIDAKNDTIAQLRSELMYARGQASQDVQTAAIQAGQRALANEVEQYVLPTPRPAYIVQNPNCCGYNYGCNCGGNGTF